MATPKELLDVTPNSNRFHKFLTGFLKTGQTAFFLTAIPNTEPAMCFRVLAL